MLPADEAFVARHRADIPGIHYLFDTERLEQLILSRSGKFDASFHLRPRYVRFKPNASCLVAYQATLDGSPIKCYAKAHSLTNAAKLEKAGIRKTTAGPLGPGNIIDADSLLSIWFFPNDRALRSLYRHLQQHPDTSILAYKPERRFVGRIDTGNGAAEVVKIYKRRSFHQATTLAKIAHALPFMPDLAATNEKHRALHLRWIPGTTLTDAMASEHEPTDLCVQAGTALGRLHQMEAIDGLAINGAEKECARVRAIARDIFEFCPELANTIEDVAEQLRRQLTDLQRQHTLIHGDYYANQILFTTTGVKILDFDELAIGVPESDIGLFLAHLELDRLRNRISAPRVDAVGRALLGGYEKIRPCDQTTVEIYTIFGMFQLAHRPFRDAMSNWPELTAAWIDLIAQRVENLSSGRINAGAQPRCSFTPQLNRALDSESGNDWVVQALRQIGTATTIRRASLLRHKPGRRAMIRYELETSPNDQGSTVLGKIRAKGLDHKAYRANVLLHQAIQRDHNIDRLRIPRPLTVVPQLDMWLQEYVSGRGGWQALDNADALTTATAIGDALRQLHQTRIPLFRSHTIDDELAILDQRLVLAGDAIGSHRQNLDRLRHRCHALSERLGTRPQQTIHRDFYPDQLIIHGPFVYMLDFDLVCVGDPALDLGNFIAHVQESDLRQFGDPNARGAVSQTILDAYCAQNDDHRLRRAVDIYRVLSLARLIHISTQFPDRRPFTLDVLNYCEHEINRIGSRGGRTAQGSPRAMRSGKPLSQKARKEKSGKAK